MRATALDRIRAFAAEARSDERMPPGAGRLIAVGWGTVETDRAVGELAASLGIARTSFRTAGGSGALGASCVVAETLLDGDVALAVLEPATEGRIAAALARWDEGPLVAWYATESGTPGARGPFGAERVVAGDPLTGPHRLLVGHAPGTIRA
ncbi:MAG: hypothetical protein ACJ78L_05205 [Chloroflexota bacterium]